MRGHVAVKISACSRSVCAAIFSADAGSDVAV
jgi:hypothetical protein